MQAIRAAALALAIVSLTGPFVQAVRVEANPLAKVIELLDSLSAKIKKEGEVEEKAFKEFVEWCDDTATNKKFEIKTLTSKKEGLEAAVGKAASEADAAGTQIESLAGSIASAEGDLKAASTVREKEAADFAKNEAELVDVVNTIGRAIQVLEREMAKNPAAFAQMDTSNIRSILASLSAVADAAAFTVADKQRLLALVQARQGAEADDEDLGAPAAAAYKTHSGGVVDVLEDMKEKAEEQLADLRKAETGARHNYAMLKASLEDERAADGKALGEARISRSSALEAKASAEGDLAETVKDLADGKGSLEMASSGCVQTAADHEATVKARGEELQAIASARKTLAETSAGAVSQTYSLLQAGSRAVSSLQTRSDLANAEVVNIVKRLAKEHHSAELAQLASRIAAVLRFGAGGGEDPFAKVRGLIKELIERLEAEAGADATEKAYCDKQMALTEEKKGELDHDISKLTAKIDQAVAKSSALKGEVRELQGELATLAKEQSEMDLARRDAHSTFAQARADLQAGLAGVRKALTVLRDYYGAAPAPALLQGGSGSAGSQRQPATPTRHSKAAGAGGSIIGLLEVVESDFAENLATEATQEDSAQADYEKMTQRNKITRNMKDQDVKYKAKEAASLDKSIADLTADRETADAELSAVLEYYAKIKDRCIAKPETYESRKQRRVAEIAGLRQALAILEDETALMQRGKRSLRHRAVGVHEQ